MMNAALLFVLVCSIAYLLGSINSAIIVSRLCGLPDPRESGSHNPGATNVLRLAGKKFALFVLLFDMFKGYVPVLLAKFIGVGLVTQGFVCFFVVLGHMYPIFFQFQGGKGVATAIGALFALHPTLGIMTSLTWIFVVQMTHYSSMASLVSMTAAPLYTLIFLQNSECFPPLFFITMFIFFKHRQNITRLMDGEEPTVQFGRKSGTEDKPKKKKK
ncbi:MAG: glycerol-3-phosphate 1-O-acyltransferase PlsY [Legionellaceae bacterium]|nr:glycerol-3-phosphate 1-O-acyltransferase PlsY [Legionellaceae bacterium]